jgi:hypothetical protein
MSSSFKPRAPFAPRVSKDSRQIAKPVTPQPSQAPFWKSPIVAIAGLGSLVIGIVSLPGILAQPIVLIQADDTSASAEKYKSLRQKLCQDSSQLLKSGDVVVRMPFADHTEVTRSQTLSNSLDLLGQCKETTPTDGKVPGTSLMRPVDRAQQQITQSRSQGNRQPIALVMTLDDAEPGPGQPALDWSHLRSQFQKITGDRGVAVIIGPTGQLQADLEAQLQAVPRLRVCPVASAKSCLEETIAAARKL